MSAAIELRGEHSARAFRELAVKAKDSNQARRLLALAAVREGKGREEAARIGGMDRQTLRDRVHAYNEKGFDVLINSKAPGRKPKLNPAQKEAVRQIVLQGPDPQVDGVVRWRCVDLRKQIKARFEVDLDEVSIGRLLKELGFAHVSARPVIPSRTRTRSRRSKKLPRP